MPTIADIQGCVDHKRKTNAADAAERQDSMTETATKPKMVGVGRGVKVPAEFKDAYVAAREEMEAAYKDEAKLAKKGKTTGDEQYDAAVTRVGRAHNTLTAVVDQIRKAIGAPGVQPPPPRPGTTMDEETKTKLKDAKRADAKANGKVIAAEDEGLAGYAPHGPGWDAKAKSDLINSALGLKFEPKVQKFSVDEAVAILERIPQWKPFYERKLAATSEATDEHDAAVKSGQ